jgi:hypothetical protein
VAVRQPELDRGHDTEAAAPAAQRPEQVGLVLFAGAYQLPVGGHQLDRVHVAGGQTVLAAQEAQAFYTLMTEETYGLLVPNTAGPCRTGPGGLGTTSGPSSSRAPYEPPHRRVRVRSWPK